MNNTICVKVIARAKRNEIKKSNGGFKAYLTTAPVDGKANKALLELLADYFHLKKSQLSIIKGERSKNKVIRVG